MLCKIVKIEIGFEVLHNLDPNTDGANSRSQFLQIDDETFIGTSFSGGTEGGGVLFEYSLSSDK